MGCFLYGLKIRNVVMHVKEFLLLLSGAEKDVCYKKEGTMRHRTPVSSLVGGTGIEPVTSTV